MSLLYRVAMLPPLHANKMAVRAQAAVWGPNLMRPQAESFIVRSSTRALVSKDGSLTRQRTVACAPVSGVWVGGRTQHRRAVYSLLGVTHDTLPHGPLNYSRTHPLTIGGDVGRT